jgi:hypothetical protein
MKQNQYSDTINSHARRVQGVYWSWWLLIAFYIGLVYAIFAISLMILDSGSKQVIKLPEVKGYANYKLYDFIY